MKKNIHPDYKRTLAICHCGAQYEIGSTEDDIHVDICAACHPVFNGDTSGRRAGSGREKIIEKFQKRYEKTDKIQEEIRQRNERKQIAQDEEEGRKKRKQERVLGKTKL